MLGLHVAQVHSKDDSGVLRNTTRKSETSPGEIRNTDETDGCRVIGISSWSFDNLSPEDISVLCNHFNLPTPTPDTPFATIATAAGYTPFILWQELRNEKSIRLTIAAAALRGLVKHLPPDPRLNPSPYPPCGKPRPLPNGKPFTPRKPYISVSTGALAESPVPPAMPPWTIPGATLTYVAPNPKRPGAGNYARYAKCAVGMDLAALRAVGVTVGDLRWDTERGFLRWSSQPAKHNTGAGD